MKIDNFFEEVVRENHPNAGKIRRWWERKKMDAWLKLPAHQGSNITNKEFVEKIPSGDY